MIKMPSPEEADCVLFNLLSGMAKRQATDDFARIILNDLDADSMAGDYASRQVNARWPGCTEALDAWWNKNEVRATPNEFEEAVDNFQMEYSFAIKAEYVTQLKIYLARAKDLYNEI